MLNIYKFSGSIFDTKLKQVNLATNSDLNTVSEHANCNCLSQWVYTERICLIMLYFQCQEIATIGKYRLSLI